MPSSLQLRVPMLLNAANKTRIRKQRLQLAIARESGRVATSGHHRHSHDCIALLQTITMPRTNIAMHVYHKWCQPYREGLRTHAQTCISQNSVPQMLPIRYAGRYANFWQQNIERKQCKRSSASSPKVCCAHMNKEAAFITGTTRCSEALFQIVSGQFTLSKEGDFGDAGSGLV